MPAIYRHSHCVAEAEIDELGHANNLAYLKWTQAAATAHSAAQGWPSRRYAAQNVAWVIRSHHITYHAAALAGDDIEVVTWVGDFLRIASTRHYRIRRVTDGTLLARARTLWVFVDRTTGRPLRIPGDLRDSFELVTTPPVL